MKMQINFLYFSSPILFVSDSIDINNPIVDFIMSERIGNCIIFPNSNEHILSIYDQLIHSYDYYSNNH